MLRMTFIIGIIDTLCRLAVDADRPAWMIERTDIRVAPSLGKTFAASTVTIAGMAASHHDIPFATTILLIITAI